MSEIPPTSPPDAHPPDAQPYAAGLRASQSIGNDAVEAFVRAHNGMLFRVARAMVRDDAEAEDIVQASLVSALHSFKDFRGGAEPRTWLTRIVINEAISRRRRVGSFTRLRNAAAMLSDIAAAPRHGAITFASSASENPESEAARSEFRVLLEHAIDKLPAHFRAVFVLRAVEEFTVEETAEALGIPAETVKTRYHRARHRLRRGLNDELENALTEVFPFGGNRCDRIVHRVLATLARH